jgi:hypothetical protein
MRQDSLPSSQFEDGLLTSIVERCSILPGAAS